MQNNLYIITSPSGAGEDSIIKGLKELFPLEKIITTTTRAMRAGEVHGRDYYFISKEEFRAGINTDKFFEWAEQDGGNLYGVTFEEINRAKKSDKIIIWKIDYKGVITAKKLMPEIPIIFINAPLEQLADRIRHRDQVTEEFVQGRLAYAQGWLDNKDIFDYEVMNANGQLTESIQKVAQILQNKKD